MEPMFDWEEVMNRDVLIKRLQQSDVSKPSASIGTTVVCNIKCYFLKTLDCVDNLKENLSIDLADRELEYNPFEQLENERYKIGKGDVVPALELGLRHSRIGDRFFLRANSRFAFGYNGRDISIPPNADLHFDIHVLNHIQESESDNTYVRAQISSVLALNNGRFNACLPEDIDRDIIENANRWAAFSDLCFRKEAGNRWFKYKDFSRAARAYAEGTKVADEYFKSIDKYQDNKNDMIKMDENGQMQINPNYRGGEGDIKGDGDSPQEENDGKDSIIFLAYVSCLNNLAACHMEQGEHLKARDLCVKVLEMDPSNLKALLRAARSSLALHVWQTSLHDTENSSVLTSTSNYCVNCCFSIMIIERNLILFTF
jgi:tetratricopeptide (TPR) repeat protein